MLALTRATVVAVALSLAPTFAHAQFGALGRAAAAAAAARNAKNAASGNTHQAPPPQFDTHTLEITPARVDQMLKGFAAEAPARAQLMKDRAAESGAREATDKYNECVELHRNQAEAQQSANAQAQGTAIQQRIMTMMQQQDYAGIKALQDSLMQAAMSTATGPDSACAPRPDSAFAVVGRLENGDRNVELMGSQGAGLTSEQYSIMRERFIGYLQTGPGYGFTSKEVDALNARKADIQRALQPVLDAQKNGQ